MENLSGSYIVSLNGKNIGEANVYDDGLRVKITMRCQKYDDRIYRLYFRDGENKISVGVAMPANDTLKLDKSMSRRELHRLGVTCISECFLSANENGGQKAAENANDAANLPETADSGEIQGKAPVQERESGGAPREQEKIVWKKVDDISPLFKSGEVAQDFEEPVGALYRKDGEFEYIAISASPDEPFPLMPVFCFGEQQSIDGKEYIVFKIKNGKLST